MIISPPAQTPSCPNRRSGAFVVVVGCHESSAGSYRPPVFVPAAPCVVCPPKRIISCPDQTAEAVILPGGVPVVDVVAPHVSVDGEYLFPVLTPSTRSKPPQTIISVPVQTAA